MENKKTRDSLLIGLASIGGMLELYDFVIYGIFSVYFAGLFFPNDNSFISIIESYSVFILGYITRPLGGVCFTYIGDKFGRKNVLILTLLVMGLSSFGIVLLPTYYQIGILAPILLISLRLIQGLALGGELPSAFVFIFESLPKKIPIAFGIVMFSVNLGVLLSMIVNKVLIINLNQEQMHIFGWRIPFLIGGILCFISFYIRKKLYESKEFKQIKSNNIHSLFNLFANHFKKLLLGIGITSIMAILVVSIYIFMPTYLRSIVKVNLVYVGDIVIIGMICNALSHLIFCFAMYYISPIKLFLAYLIGAIFLFPLGYYLISIEYFIPGLMLLAALGGIAGVITPVLITNLFPTDTRLAGVAMSYNLSIVFFGGLSPIIIAYFSSLGFNKFIINPIYTVGTILLIALPCAYIYFKMNIINKFSN
jgi:MFS family permease